jgi:hypothetical protein
MMVGSACGAVEPEQTTSVEQPWINNQSTTLHGMNLQGASLANMSMQGIRFAGATLSGAPLSNVRIERGELVADSGSTTLRNTALSGAHVFAQVRNLAAGTSAVIEYRIGTIIPEVATYDPTHTGNTYLYPLEQWVSESASWQPACPADEDGRAVAIPLAATWDETGARVASTSLFSFGCTTGAIAKCYRWGYRPWVTGYGDLVAMHWTCTRLARADYCGIGRPHTRYRTGINVWDNLPLPGPIQGHGGLLPPLGMLFEAGWDTGGAVCLSHSRWILDDGLELAALCPGRLILPSLLPATCDTLGEVLGLNANAKMFNEAYLNLL